MTRNVGVEMTVTPNVENDDTISLILEPRVTEFEGFVEYGGPSVALDGSGTTVTVPAGFYQPIFSVREITTEVTVFDGATVVMGGLTRDEVKTVNDKVPVLGDIPGYRSSVPFRRGVAPKAQSVDLCHGQSGQPRWFTSLARTIVT